MVDISICMVSLNCWDVLQSCMHSIEQSQPSIRYEVIIVDNASSDDTLANLKVKSFSQTKVLQNNKNIGFARATNQAIRLSTGKYILWLNTDTILNPDALYQLWKFMEENPKAGIVGPKVLNADGTFQPQCRRGLPTPLASVAYLLKLDRIWPAHPGVGQYLLTYLPVDQACQVEAVSGCCLMARREAWDSIGPLDESIFGFGEDLDWCVRAKQGGWEVWYDPGSVIVHLKGQGGAHAKPFHKVWGIHQAMWIFYRKHLISKYPRVVGISVWLGIGISLFFSMIWAMLCQIKRVFFHRS